MERKVKFNVRAWRTETAGHQARAGENVASTACSRALLNISAGTQEGVTMGLHGPVRILSNSMIVMHLFGESK
jgi:hypothetical protein